MARIIVVTSGKGGVGKTTTAAAFAMGLAERGLKTVVIDFDVGLRNLDLIMGCERRVVFDFVNVIRGNVLAIPVDETLLYVEPIYLRAETAAVAAVTLTVAAWEA